MVKPYKKDYNHLFDLKRETYGTGHRQVAAISCHVCGLTKSVGVFSNERRLPPEVVVSLFSNKGWQMGKTKDQHTCQSCVSKRPNLKIVPKINSEDSMKTEKLQVSEPRVMTREDKRIIYDKINEVYVDEKRGYDNGWSDHKLATDLGVPRKWIEEVREDMFGPVATNPDIEEFNRSVASLSEIKIHLIDIQEKLNKLDISDVNARVAKLERLSAEIKKHIP
jgi:hypothetical protein